MKLRSELTREQLEDLLTKLRGLSKLDGDEAVALADLVAADILDIGRDLVRADDAASAAEDEQVDRDLLRHSLKQAEQEIQELESRIESGDLYLGDDDSLSGTIDYALSMVRSAVREEFASEIAAMRKRAEDVQRRAGFAFHTGRVIAVKDSPLASITSVQRVLRETDEARAYFERQGSLTETLAAQIREAREYACWHRARKKLADRDVARSTGNEKKVAKLEAEAGTLLAQDWSLGFPGETPPSLP